MYMESLHNFNQIIYIFLIFCLVISCITIFMVCLSWVRIVYIFRYLIPREKQKKLKKKKERIDNYLVSVQLIPTSNDDPAICPICYDSLESELNFKDLVLGAEESESKENDVVKLSNCIHMFHETCIRDWIEKQYPTLSCPICRQGDPYTSRIQMMELGELE